MRAVYEIKVILALPNLEGTVLWVYWVKFYQSVAASRHPEVVADTGFWGPHRSSLGFPGSSLVAYLQTFYLYKVRYFYFILYALALY